MTWDWNKLFTHIKHHSGWPREFGQLNPSLHSRITSVSLNSGPHSNLFTSATVRIPVHTAPKGRTELIRYVTLHFRNWRSAAPLRCRSHRSNVWTEVLSGRAIFVWPWNENARTKQKQQTNGNRAIWLVYRMDTNVRVFWLVKRTLGWKNFTSKNVLEINGYFALTSYCNTIGQSSNAFSILGFSLAGKRRLHVLIFLSIGWKNK